ncbi:MAG: hypothetical protein Q7S87_08660 [Agitococcus sp.]|nr:hypothetical protein [Agitococcus sp.]MDO9177641.1 hypothetical protein [Agitococcus sp.]
MHKPMSTRRLVRNQAALAIFAQYAVSARHADDIAHALARIEHECPLEFTYARSAWEFITGHPPSVHFDTFSVELVSATRSSTIFDFFSVEEQHAGLARLKSTARQTKDEYYLVKSSGHDVLRRGILAYAARATA